MSLFWGIGGGGFQQPNTQEAVAQALRSAREAVAPIKEYMQVYRSTDGWLYTFSAFGLPSPFLQGHVRHGVRSEAARVGEVEASRQSLRVISNVPSRRRGGEHLRSFPN